MIAKVKLTLNEDLPLNNLSVVILEQVSLLPPHLSDL